MMCYALPLAALVVALEWAQQTAWPQSQSVRDQLFVGGLRDGHGDIFYSLLLLLLPCCMQEWSEKKNKSKKYGVDRCGCKWHWHSFKSVCDLPLGHVEPHNFFVPIAIFGIDVISCALDCVRNQIWWNFVRCVRHCGAQQIVRLIDTMIERFGAWPHTWQSDYFWHSTYKYIFWWSSFAGPYLVVVAAAKIERTFGCRATLQSTFCLFLSIGSLNNK